MLLVPESPETKTSMFGVSQCLFIAHYPGRCCPLGQHQLLFFNEMEIEEIVELCWWKYRIIRLAVKNKTNLCWIAVKLRFVLKMPHFLGQCFGINMKPSMSLAQLEATIFYICQILFIAWVMHHLTSEIGWKQKFRRNYWHLWIFRDVRLLP